MRDILHWKKYISYIGTKLEIVDQWFTKIPCSPSQPQKFKWPVWPRPLTYWPGIGTWHIVPSWVVFVPHLHMIHKIGNITAKWPWRYGSRSEVIMHKTPSHASDHLCQTWKQFNQNGPCCRADMKRYAIFLQFYCKVMAEWPWRHRSGSKAVARNTSSHISDHLCQIWKKNSSIQSCIACSYFSQPSLVPKLCTQFKTVQRHWLYWCYTPMSLTKNGTVL